MSSSASGVGFAMGNPAQAAGHEAPEGEQAKQTSPRRASALQLALPPAEATEETAPLPAENDLDDEALFQKLKDRKAGVMKKPAAATSGRGNLPKDKSAAAESKTAGQGHAKKKGKGKGKGKLSKDKSASQKGQRQRREAASRRLAGQESQAKVPPYLGGRLYPEELCFSHVQASRDMGKAPRLLGAARGRVPAKGPQRGHAAVEEENGC